ncbi:MAG: hypothetical protein CSA62_14890 [Planctomycetota bacterium]|nr:MAG: hypothetical protein CSA62_14890 [Planctomycetota bacterium]
MSKAKNSQPRPPSSMFRQAVASAPQPIMLTDRQLRIRYLNAKSKQMLRRLEAWLFFPLSQVLGLCIDELHEDLVPLRQVLGQGGWQPPAQVELSFGPENYELVATSLHSAKGAFRGLLLSWELVCEKLSGEQEEEARQAASAELLAERARILAGFAAFDKSAEQIAEALERLHAASRNTQVQALNAAIQAAQAGEPGLGFGHIAEELRRSAERSCSLAKEISEMLEAARRGAMAGVLSEPKRVRR